MVGGAGGAGGGGMPFGLPGPCRLVSTGGADCFMKEGALGAGAGGTMVATDASGISSAGGAGTGARSLGSMAGAGGAGAGGTGEAGSFIFFSQQPSLEGDQDLNRANALLGDAA